MKKYLFLISFILITVVFSGCFNEKNTASFDNQTERNFTVSENSTDTEKSTNDLITANNQNTILLNEPDNSIQNILRYSLDNRSILKRPNLGSKLKNQTEINTADNASFDKNILGTYKVIFFGSQVVKVDNAILGSVVDMYYISNDCKKAEKLYPDIVNNGLKNQCSLLTQSKILDGVVTISYDKNNQINIVSRLQMEGGIIENSPSDKYQYTEYFPIKNPALLKGRGVTNWNYNISSKHPSNTAKIYKSSPFKMTTLDNDLIRIDMTLLNKMITAVGKDMMIDAKNTIIIKKISQDTAKLENKVQKKFSR